ncbi:hypothetical protein [Streptomyces sp. NPDC007916]|uniref:hypothetical protein n=1 Tax=Streptomyces sp. NPDC007916 TaxID=3364792 RepID=UPI0036EBD8BC
MAAARLGSMEAQRPGSGAIAEAWLGINHGRDVHDHVTRTLLRHPGSDQGGDDEWDDIIIQYPVMNTLQQGGRQRFSLDR